MTEPHLFVFLFNKLIDVDGQDSTNVSKVIIWFTLFNLTLRSLKKSQSHKTPPTRPQGKKKKKKLFTLLSHYIRDLIH